MRSDCIWKNGGRCLPYREERREHTGSCVPSAAHGRRERLASFLSLPSNEIGQFGGGKNKRTGIVDVAVIQSLHRKGVVQDFVADYGHLIADECHHLSAFTFESVLRQIKGKYVLGLTATPT